MRKIEKRELTEVHEALVVYLNIVLLNNVLKMLRSLPPEKSFEILIAKVVHWIAFLVHLNIEVLTDKFCVCLNHPMNIVIDILFTISGCISFFKHPNGILTRLDCHEQTQPIWIHQWVFIHIWAVPRTKCIKLHLETRLLCGFVSKAYGWFTPSSSRQQKLINKDEKLIPIDTYLIVHVDKRVSKSTTN